MKFIHLGLCVTLTERCQCSQLWCNRLLHCIVAQASPQASSSLEELSSKAVILRCVSLFMAFVLLALCRGFPAGAAMEPPGQAAAGGAAALAHADGSASLSRAMSRIPSLPLDAQPHIAPPLPPEVAAALPRTTSMQYAGMFHNLSPSRYLGAHRGALPPLPCPCTPLLVACLCTVRHTLQVECQCPNFLADVHPSSCLCDVVS
jgi:hypothetical protein